MMLDLFSSIHQQLRRYGAVLMRSKRWATSTVLYGNIKGSVYDQLVTRGLVVLAA